MADKDNDVKGAAAALPLHADAGTGVKPVAPLDNAAPVPDKDKQVSAEDMNKLGLIAPLPTITRSVEQVYGKDVETVTMVFPCPVTIVNAQKQRIHFPIGPQEVPVVDKDNWYLKANKVVFYEGKK